MIKWLNCFFIIFALLFAVPSYAFARGEGEFFGTILIGILVAAVVFLILREFMCWYWKIRSYY